MPLHKSMSDLVNHYTVDVFVKDVKGSTTLDLPIGAVHIYKDSGLKVFTEPRTKAMAVSVYYVMHCL